LDLGLTIAALQCRERKPQPKCSTLRGVSLDVLARRKDHDLSKPMDTYLEIGGKRTFAGAIEWPGWCRSGGDEQSALQALVDYGPRYEGALRHTSLGFH
jgi:hypothetical protein